MRNSAEQIVDEILVLDAQNGRREALEALVTRWQKRLWAHAYQLTGHADAAWDITQESWLHIIRGLGRLNDPAKFGSWAYRIVSNKTFDWIKRHGGAVAPFESEETPASIEPTQHDMSGEIHLVLKRLSVNSQAVLKLYYLDGFDLAEIADILSTPAGTVKSRLHAARIEFRKHWESLGKPVAMPASGREK